MNRLTLLILLVAAVQVYCGPCKSLLVVAYIYTLHFQLQNVAGMLLSHLKMTVSDARK